jgi:hypothetical protein
MRWTTKARVQRWVAALPRRIGDPLYFRIQRATGFFRSLDPFPYLEAARDLALAAERAGRPVAGARVLEVGTGRRMMVPLAFHLLGAARITTADLHRYLRPELIRRDLDLLREDPGRAAAVLAPLTPSGDLAERLATLRGAAGRSLPAFLTELGAEYRPLCDCGRLPDADGSYDLHVSRSVLEHVPPPELERIFREGRRLVADGGALVHLIDFSDHYSADDPSASTINFLRFGGREWMHLSGNRFAYHNRWRSDDFEKLFARVGLRVVESALVEDRRARDLLREGFPLHDAYRGRDAERLVHRQGLYVLGRSIGPGASPPGQPSTRNT